MRKFLTFEGEVLEETEWRLKPTDRCFYCSEILFKAHANCVDSIDGRHDWITLVNPSTRR